MLTTKTNRKSTLRESLAHLLLLLFVGFFVSISFFKHKHVIDGVIIVHSHPFSASENHSHSADAASLIQQLSHFESKSACYASMALASFIYIRLIAASTKRYQIVVSCRSQQFSRPPPTPLL